MLYSIVERILFCMIDLFKSSFCVRMISYSNILFTLIGGSDLIVGNFDNKRLVNKLQLPSVRWPGMLHRFFSTS